MFNDFELMYYYRSNPTDVFNILESEYRKLMYSAIHQVCYNFSSVCFTVEDAYQEGLLSLLSALETYREDMDTIFSSYLFRCVSSSARLLVRRHMSLSFGLLDRCFSLQYPISSDESLMLMDVVAEEKAWYQPEVMTNYLDVYHISMDIVYKLKPFEREVFELRNNGLSYQEIADITHLSTKKIDNILQKLRRQVRAQLD